MWHIPRKHLAFITGILLLAFAAPASAVSYLNVETPGVTDLLLTGPTAYRSGRLGSRIATGDFNGDGIEDLVVSGPSMNSPTGIVRAGMIYLYFGSPGVRNLPAELAVTANRQNVLMFGALEKERAGEMLAVGDLNHDGKSDLVIVAQNNPVYNEGTTAIARIYVVYGRAAFASQMNLSSSADVVIERTRAAAVSSTWPTFQISALTLGDINKDGFDDLVFSDKVNNVFGVLFGRATKWSSPLDLATDTDVVLQHSVAVANLYSTAYFPLYNQAEIAGVAVGDLNRDGIKDLALGVPNETVSGKTNAGRVYVVFGRTSYAPLITIDSGANVKIEGGCVKDKIGGPLAIGDLNADGAGDLVIGAPLSQHCIVNSTGLGQVDVVFGRSSFAATLDLFSSANARLSLSGDGDPDSGSVVRIGFKTGQELLVKDLDGDGIADLTIGSPGAFFAQGDNGWVHTVRGGAGFKDYYALDQRANLWVHTPEPTGPRLISGRLGEAIGILDFDHNGRPDLVTGAPAGLSTVGGFVPVIYDPLGKLVAQLDSSFMLRVPHLNVAGVGALKVNLQFNGALFVLSGYDLAAVSSDAPSSFNSSTGKVLIPEVRYGNLVFKNAVLQWVPQVLPLGFQLISVQ